MKKIITLLMIILLVGCSSSAAGNSEYPPTERNQPDEQNNTGNNVSNEPFGGVDADGWYIVETEDEQPATGGSQTETVPNENNSVHNEPVAGEIDPSSFDVSKLNYEEFDNLYGQITYNGVPEGRESQPLKNANGVWRYNLKRKYDDPSQGYMYDELGYAQMYVKGSDDPPIRITLHPRKASDGYEVWDESDESAGYEPFAGNIDDDNIIRLIGNDAILVPEYYYAYQGKEYLIAKQWLSEESYMDFLMIREKE